MHENDEPTTLREKPLTFQDFLDIEIVFRASGFKSSEGDGRTAADIENEQRAERARRTD